MNQLVSAIRAVFARRLLLPFVFVFVLALTAACGGDSGEETILPTPIVEATQPQPAATEPSPTEPIESPSAEAPPSPAPTEAVEEPTTAASPTAVPPTAIPPTAEPPTIVPPTATSPSPTTEPIGAGDYRVVYVPDNDFLNLREGPGVENEIILELEPDVQGIVVHEEEQTLIDDVTWVMAEAGDVEGWIHSHFLTQMVDAAAFCEDPEALALLEDLGTAIASQDGVLLGSLVHPERGLRIHHDWWNPEIFIEGEAAADLFNSDRSYLWGTQDGSGSAIRGSFSDVILPTLEEDYLAATELGCDEILAGGTAGLVQLPEIYDGLHYFSVYRPAPEGDETGFDWGTWVVGIDRWQDQYYLAYLVHFDYEI